MNKLTLITSGLMVCALIACDKENVSPDSKSFQVVIENVSVNNTIPSARLNGTVPLSHGVYAVMSSGSLFSLGQAADDGTSRIAEDGFTTEKTNALNNMSGIFDHGEFVAPGGPDNGAALFTGESSTFIIYANDGDKLQIQSMFVQSDDWFFSFGDGGLPLFNNGTAISGDFTSELVLYDAGTEADDAPGTGLYQKPVQGPTDMNFGPADLVTNVTEARVRHTQFTIPPTNSVIKITITPRI